MDQIHPIMKLASNNCNIPTIKVVTRTLDPMNEFMIVPIPGKKMFTIIKIIPQGLSTATKSEVSGSHILLLY